MPLYEYECDACGNRFEKIQKFSDPLADTCPKCGGPVHKLMSSPAIQFKGSGWYITDYPKKDSSKGNDSSKDTNTGSNSGKDAKADSGGESKSGSDAAKDTKPAADSAAKTTDTKSSS